MKKIELLNTAVNRLNENNIPDAEDSALRLLAHVLNIDYSKLCLQENIKDDVVDDYLALIDSRCNHVPLDRLIGYKYFFQVKIPFNKSVLTPRYETEFLVERVIMDIKNKYSQTRINLPFEPVTVLDMCTGSGCVGLSIAWETGANVTMADISKNVITIAKENCELNNEIRNEQSLPPINPTFLVSDMFENITCKYDIIVCNPPYIKSTDLNKLEIEVRDFDPALALDGGKDGLDFYRNISKNAHKYLKPNGMLYLEVGYDQAEKVAKMLDKNFENIEIKKDLANIDRFIIAKKREKNVK